MKICIRDADTRIRAKDTETGKVYVESSGIALLRIDECDVHADASDDIPFLQLVENDLTTVLLRKDEQLTYIGEPTLTINN